MTQHVTAAENELLIALRKYVAAAVNELTGTAIQGEVAKTGSTLANVKAAAEEYVAKQEVSPKVAPAPPKEAAAKPTPKAKEAAAAAEEEEKADRPFRKAPKSRATKLDMQLKNAVESGATAEVINAAQRAVWAAEKKKVILDLKRLDKLKVSQPDDVDTIEIEIGHVNADLTLLDENLAATEASTLIPEAGAQAKPKVVPAPPKAKAPPAPKAKETVTVLTNQMTELAGDVTYEGFIENGWDDEGLIENGYMVVVETEAPVEGNAVVDDLTVDEVNTEMARIYAAAVPANLINELNEIVVEYGGDVTKVPEGSRNKMIGELLYLVGLA